MKIRKKLMALGMTAAMALSCLTLPVFAAQGVSIPAWSLNGTSHSAGVQDANFYDVQDSSMYYYLPVYWAAGNGIAAGVAPYSFAPDWTCTRAQIVTFLYRLAGEPYASRYNSFVDVPSGEYYASAVTWAVDNGITQGTGNGCFSPDANCTRAQIVTFLYNFAGKPGVYGQNRFRDVPEYEYYRNAVVWATQEKITSGTGTDTFSPEDSCTRGQAMTFEFNFAVKDRNTDPDYPEPAVNTVPFPSEHAREYWVIYRNSDDNVCMSMIDYYGSEDDLRFTWDGNDDTIYFNQIHDQSSISEFNLDRNNQWVYKGEHNASFGSGDYASDIIASNLDITDDGFVLSGAKDYGSVSFDRRSSYSGVNASGAAFPSENARQYWVIYRNTNDEICMSTIDYYGPENDLKFTWGGNDDTIYFNQIHDQSSISEFNLDRNNQWVYKGEHNASFGSGDYASDIIASNLDITDNDEVLMPASDYESSSF